MSHHTRSVRESDEKGAFVCRHCGALPEVDLDHSCPCPYSDETCTDHPRRDA